MTKPHPHDISIGKDRWITFIELDGRQAEALDIDSVLEPIQSFLGLLETECVVACCGIDALGLWAQDIARARRDCHDPDIGTKVAAVRDQVMQSSSTTLVSHKLNNYFDRQVLVAMLNHIAVCLATTDDSLSERD
jgi:hypothetical protein